MTFRSSSIFSSSYTRFLAVGAITWFCIVAAVMCASFVAIRYNLIHWQFGSLLDYQIEKLQGDQPIDILLIGDSSFGKFCRCKAMVTQNRQERRFGGFDRRLQGLYGSLNMILRAARHHKLTAVIIMQTVDLMERSPNRMGNLYTAERLEDISRLGVLQHHRRAGQLGCRQENDLACPLFRSH